MERLEMIEEILSKYVGKSARFKATVDMLCDKGIKNGCFQDYTILIDILEILSICESVLEED